MNPRILAKGRSDDYMSLYDHTDHVVASIERFAQQYSFDLKVARQGAILHDLGKAHPAFQAMLIEKPIPERDRLLETLPSAHAVLHYLDLRDDGEQVIYRHELGSLGFLPLVAQSTWPAMVEMIVAHHKSILNDKSKRGILDLISNHNLTFDEVADDHFAFWDDWAPGALEVAKRFGLAGKFISATEARAALKYAYEYVRNTGSGWSAYRGLLMSADHFGSGYKYEAGKQSASLFGMPDWSAFVARTKSSRAHLYPLSLIPSDDPRQHTIVTAPTGAGKTDFLIRRCRQRIFYTLPFQASINAMHARFTADMPGADVRRLHSASRVNLDAFEEKSQGSNEKVNEDLDLQQHPGAAVKVLTPHQLVSLTLLTPGHEAVALDIRGQDVILDEVHTYSAEARTMILKIVEVLLLHECRIHIGTATLPSWLGDQLYQMLGGNEGVHRVALPPQVLDTFDRHTVHKTINETTITEREIRAIVAEAIQHDRKILLVANRVKRAQGWYEQLRMAFPAVPIALIHSRYRRMDRAKLETEIISLQEKDRHGPAIAVATQVVEVSLDISFDCMITDAAPLDALIQRFGRVNRRRSKETIGKYKPIYVLEPPTDESQMLPYTGDAVRSSYGVLPDGEVLRERNVQKLMDQVFHSPEERVEANDYMVTSDGTYRLGKLEHRPRGTVVSVLKIDGNTCVTVKDLPAYRAAKFDVKPNYEIPVPASFGRYGLCTEESGSYPYILPTEHYHFSSENRMGLTMQKKEEHVKDQLL